MYKYIQRLLLAAFAAGLAACGGGGSGVVPQSPAADAGAAPAQVAGPRFAVTALPAGFVPRAIMRDGQIAGAQGADAAIFANGGVSVLPSLPGAVRAVALWVNARGHAVGNTAFENSPHPLVATLFAGGTARNLNPQAPARQAESADLIGEQDQIYGTSDREDFLNSLDLVRFSPAGGFIHLDPVNGERAAGFIYDINRSGRFAGFEWPDEIPFNLATMAMTGSDLTITLMPVDFITSVNTAINDAGEVAGYVDPSNSDFNTSGTWQAFVRTRGGPTIYIPSLPGSTYMQPAGINGRGDVVGICRPDFLHGTAFFYTHGVAYDVGSSSTPALGNVVQVMHGLSDRGEFVVQTTTGYYLVRAK